MLPLFLYPVAAVGLLTLPCLAAIYWFRNRYRRRVVSSLMLWLDARQTRDGGTRWQRLQTPLLFFLEILVLLLLVFALADPQWARLHGARPLVVVLDDSFSMLAGGEDSARKQAALALMDELGRTPRPSVRFLLAGETPTMLGEPARATSAIAEALNGWRCRAPSACLDQAIALASEVGGERSLLLVLTDHARSDIPTTGRLRWWAFGKARPNIAFVNAVRTAREGSDRCLLEIANLSPQSKSTTLSVEANTPPRELHRAVLNLAAGETRRVTLKLDEGTPAIHAKLDDDELMIDNSVTLLPVVSRPLRVDMAVGDERTRTALDKAVVAVRNTVRADVGPDLFFTDDSKAARPDAWTVRIVRDEPAEAYVGPFLLDHAHPLVEGLPLQGVVWGAGTTTELPGTPVVLAGNVPLVTDIEQSGDRHEIRLRLRTDLSTLQDSPAWPILIWNLMQWRSSRLPGLSRPNLRLGEDAMIILPKGTDKVGVVSPGGQAYAASVNDNRAIARPNDIGVHEVRAGTTRYSFAVNALNREESDLTECASGRWGDWLDETSLQLEYEEIRWIALLLILSILTLHLYLVARAGRPAV